MKYNFISVAFLSGLAIAALVMPVSSEALAQSVGPALTYAEACPSGDAAAGVQAGDQVVLFFDQPTNAFDVTSLNVDDALALSNAHVWGNIASAEWSYSDSTLTITLAGTGNPTIAVGDDITIESGTIQDETEALDATGSPPGIDGTFGGSPALICATAFAAGSDVSGIQDGDEVVLLFDNATNAYTITANNIDATLALSGNHTWGSIDSATWEETWYPNDTLVVVLDTTTAPTVAVGDSITIASNTIRDPDDCEDAVGSPPEIGGSFGSPAELLSATAQPTGDVAAGVQEDDRVVIVFDKPTNGFEITAENIDTVLPVEGKFWGDVASAEWTTAVNDNDTLTIGFGDGGGTTVEVGDEMQISADTIENEINGDDAGNLYHVRIWGTFGDTPPVLLSAVAYPSGSTFGGVQDGDSVVLTFDSPTNACEITSENIDDTLFLPGNHHWGGVDSAVWSSVTMPNDTLTITFDGTALPTVRVGDCIFLSYDGIMDSTETYVATSDTWVAGSFGNGPQLQYATLVDTSGLGEGIQADDTINIAFDQPTNYHEVTTNNIDSVLPLDHSHTWGAIQSAEWSDDGYLLTITFDSGTHTVEAGDSLAVGAETIMDWAETDSVTGSQAIDEAPDDTGDLTITLTGPLGEWNSHDQEYMPPYLNSSSVTVTGSVTDTHAGVRWVQVLADGFPVGGEGTLSATVPLENEGLHTVFVEAFDNLGNYDCADWPVCRDTQPPEPYDPWTWCSIPDPVSAGESVAVYAEFWDAFSGVDLSGATATLAGDGGSAQLVQSYGTYGDWYWHGTIPSGMNTGPTQIEISDVSDRVGNVMDDCYFDGPYFVAGPPKPTVTTQSGHIFPFYVEGTKSTDAVSVQWKYACDDDTHWTGVSKCGDTWWWGEVGMSGGTYSGGSWTWDVQFRSVDGAGHHSQVETRTLTFCRTAVSDCGSMGLQAGDSIRFPAPPAGSVAGKNVTGAWIKLNGSCLQSWSYDPQTYDPGLESMTVNYQFQSDGTYLFEAGFDGFDECLPASWTVQSSTAHVVARLQLNVVAGWGRTSFPSSSTIWNAGAPGNLKNETPYVLATLQKTASATYSMSPGSAATLPSNTTGWDCLTGLQSYTVWWVGALTPGANTFTYTSTYGGAVSRKEYIVITPQLTYSPNVGPIGTVVTLRLPGWLSSGTTVGVTGHSGNSTDTSISYSGETVHYDVNDPDVAKIIIGDALPSLTWVLANSSRIDNSAKGILTISSSSREFEFPFAFTAVQTACLGNVNDNVFEEAGSVRMGESYRVQVLLKQDGLTVDPPTSIMVGVQSFDRDGQPIRRAPARHAPSRIELEAEYVGLTQDHAYWAYWTREGEPVVPWGGTMSPHVCGTWSYVFAPSDGSIGILPQ